jgi:hypothetical protein
MGDIKMSSALRCNARLSSWKVRGLSDQSTSLEPHSMPAASLSCRVPRSSLIPCPRLLYRVEFLARASFHARGFSVVKISSLEL